MIAGTHPGGRIQGLCALCKASTGEDRRTDQAVSQLEHVVAQANDDELGVHGLLLAKAGGKMPIRPSANPVASKRL